MKKFSFLFYLTCLFERVNCRDIFDFKESIQFTDALVMMTRGGQMIYERKIMTRENCEKCEKISSVERRRICKWFCLHIIFIYLFENVKNGSKSRHSGSGRTTGD